MKIYTIGIERSECYGHGDYGMEVKIAGMGSYGIDGFPPCFKTSMEAGAYLESNNDKFCGKTRIVELNLI